MEFNDLARQLHAGSPPEGALFPGVCNARDLGGFAAAGGTRVRTGMVYRSGDLSRMTKQGISAFQACNIRTVIDFRTDQEIAASPDLLPHGVTLEHIPIAPGDVMNLARTACEDHCAQVMRELYELLPRTMQPEYRRMFRLLEKPAAAPVLLHCTAGKDRTGFAAVLFLASLGVTREEIIRDYEASAPQVEAFYKPMVTARPELAPLLTVRREYIEASYGVLNHTYGGIDAYLTNQLAVDLPRMREIYTT